MLAGVFINGGIEVFREPEPRAEQAGPLIDRMVEKVPALPPDRVGLVRANAAIHVGAGTALALGILPRLAALTLAGSLVPTTLGGHRFWEIEDTAQSSRQRVQFLKNAAIMGGLLVFALDM